MYVARRSFSKLSDVKNAAAQVATRPAAAQQGVRPSQQPQHEPSHDLKVTRLPNDLVVVSQDGHVGAGLSRVSVAVKSGARYEPPELPGIAHVLRNSASLATKHCSAFGLVRNLEQLGASLKATTTRDHTIYNLDCPRENLHDALRFLAYVTTQHQFRPWEVKDSQERLRVDLEVFKATPQIRLIENLHKAAFRGGLAHSLYAPEFAYKHLNSQMLTHYVKQTFATNRMSLSGIGVSHENLVTFATDYLKFDTSPSTGNASVVKPDASETAVSFTASSDSSSRYIGGEIFEDTVDHLAYVALVTEGAGTNKPQDALALALLRELLGTEPHIKWSNGVSALTRAASSVTQNPVAISALNIAHSDSGLFGFSAVASAKDIGNVLRAAVEVMKGKAGVDDKKLQAAKSRLIASILMAEEQGGEVVQDLAVQALNTGGVLTSSDAVSIVEKISVDQLVNVAKKATSGKATLAGVGNLSHFPRLDDLLRQ